MSVDRYRSSETTSFLVTDKMARVFVATVFIFVVLFAELPKAIDSCQKNLATQTIEPYPGCIGKFQSEVCVGYCLSSQVKNKFLRLLNGVKFLA